MNKKGFTLFEILSVIFVVIIIFLLAIPIVQGIIKFSRYGAFKVSAASVIDAVDYHIANNKFIEIPLEGIDISDMDDTILKNNNFESGRIIRSNNQTELVYLVQGDYCAKGTKEKLETSDKGCGKLDKTAPIKADVFLKNKTSNSTIYVVDGFDSESKIIKYEISIDGGKFYSNGDPSYNVFVIDDILEHDIKVRITNEARLSLVTSSKKIKINNKNTFSCKENNNKLISNYKEIVCEENEYIYQYSFDETNWKDLENNNLKINKNEIVYMRALLNNEVVSYNTFNINNIDNLLNESYPVLTKNMVPVIFDKEKGWIVADRNTIYWDYENKLWANAIVVKKDATVSDDLSKSRNYYLSNDAIGEKVYENDILAQYVWIPRFKYKLWNTTGTDIKANNHGVREIKIEFASKDQINEKEGYNNDDWYTHPAFSYNEEYNGFWVNKYEVSINKEATCNLVSNPDNCDKDYFEIYSILNNSLKNISILNAYKITNSLNEKFNRYGLDTSSIPHIVTNLEWGAIAYLSHSRYGINTNITDNTTTGNETGIYGMGQNSEFVMANHNNKFGNFKELEQNKLIDYYNSISSKGRIIGDATSETEKWYDSENNFLNVTNPFMIRGTNSIFDFNNNDGSPNSTITFRTALIIK